MMTEVRNSLVTREGGPYIMTDDRAPVELLGMRQIDELISDETAYYKALYREKGLSGLIEILKDELF